MQILFVCSGNTCRSPMAAALYQSLHPDDKVGSAGLHASSGQPAARPAIQVAKKFGLDLSSHRAKQLDERALQVADWVVTMTKDQAQILRRMYPHQSERVITFADWTKTTKDIADPFGGSYALYEEVFLQMRKAFQMEGSQ